MPFKKIALHGLLFVITLITTTVAGAEWIYGQPFFLQGDTFSWQGWLSMDQVLQGLHFSLPFLLVLTVHEFGHYITARRYNTQVTLPYYIPLWLGITNSIGTMGAFIRIKSRIFSRKEFFDIGIAGPLAGFAVALPLLFYAFLNLPEPEHIFTIHPEYMPYGLHYASYVYPEGLPKIALGKNLLFLFFENFVADPARLPHKYEAIHYPYIFAGYLSLFFTALNLLPIGQLDGGHILYGLIGYRRFNQLSVVLFLVFIGYASIGIVSPYMSWEEAQWLALPYLFYLVVVFRPLVPEVKHMVALVVLVVSIQMLLLLFFPDLKGYPSWLVFGFLLARFLGVFHPPCPNEQPLSRSRVWLGIVALVVFVLCFSPTPFIIE